MFLEACKVKAMITGVDDVNGSSLTTLNDQAGQSVHSNLEAGGNSVNSTSTCHGLDDNTCTSGLDATVSTCTNVYVANLPASADACKIRELFSSVGKVLHVKVLLDIATGVSRGIAFVMFEDLPTARKACVLKNKVVLDGSVLQVRLAERSSLHSTPDTHVRSNIVYIRNVPGNITKQQVKQFCEINFGTVVDVVPHPQSCEQSGPSPFNMVFVTFEDVDVACRCVEGVDGKAPFPLPQPSHPFTMAKMISDIGGEMRKSILLRRRGSEPGTPSPQQLSGLPGKPPQSSLSLPFNNFQLSPHGLPLAAATPPQSPGNVALAPQRLPQSLPQQVHPQFTQQHGFGSPILVQNFGIFSPVQQMLAGHFATEHARRDAVSGTFATSSFQDVNVSVHQPLNMMSAPPNFGHQALHLPSSSISQSYGLSPPQQPLAFQQIHSSQPFQFQHTSQAQQSQAQQSQQPVLFVSLPNSQLPYYM